MKKHLLFVLFIAIVLVLSVSLAACGSDAAINNGENNNVSTDDNYSLTVSGIGVDDIVITKKQIKDIFAIKPVIFDEENPVYASDKTDDAGNPIPHTIKGVYFDDVLSEYADGALSGAYSSMTLKSLDGYESVLTSDIYNTEHGGSKMIIAINYDGEDLKETSKSGALRAVFPNQIANSWAKFLSEIVFGNATLLPPEPTTLNFCELIDSAYFGQFEKTIEIGTGSETVTYYGISLDSLIDEGILNADENDKMFISAWDYITNGTESFYREYINWKSYEIYSDAYLVYETQTEGGAKTPYDLSPALNSALMQSGMTVKNVLSLSVNDTALVSLKIAFERYKGEGESTVAIKNILENISMFDSVANYKITDREGNETTVTADDLTSAQISFDGDDYILTVGGNDILIKTITLIK